MARTPTPKGSTMTEDAKRFEALIAAIDGANGDDPRRVLIGGAERAYEVVYAARMSARLAILYPDASEALRIAARAQHIRRWEIVRADYTEGRGGYNDWRRAARAHHGVIAGRLMRAHGYAEDAIARVASLIAKEQLKKDRDSQALENVVDVVFVEHYLDEFLTKHRAYDDAKIIDILGKTLRKMSPKGHQAALALVMPERNRALVTAAVAREATALAKLAAVAID